MSRSVRLLATVLLLFTLLVSAYLVYAWSPVPVSADPLVRMPGTQPAQGVTLEGPNRCLNCHAGYNQSVEPGFNWEGSMMAQASRDFMWWAAMTVAAQDSLWAVGTPNATDICERCHFPMGWLEGRSDPTNASAMTGDDYNGVQCDFCHRMYDPFFETTYDGTREGSDWLNYWDETNLSSTPSQAAAAATYAEDRALASVITYFNGDPFFVNNLPASANYTEATSGQYFVSTTAEKRASFADAAARHQMLYSRFHKSKYFCATCHDVSNPIIHNLGADPTQPLPSELVSASAYVQAERTFSEFQLSAYGRQGGAAGIGPFAPDVYDTSLGNNYISRCQDCHMRDVVGAGANKNGVPVRPDDSSEHPLSGQPLHDMTGGNVWVSRVLASAVPGSPNYNAINDQLLNQGAAVLTLDLNQGLGINPEALLAGADRALQQLQLAATIENVSYDGGSGALSFRVQNQTGHKLISGFPEGRRMFVNVKGYDSSGALLFEVNPYDATAGTLKGLPLSPNSPALGANEFYVDELVYEVHPNSTLTGAVNETELEQTFHFALATGRYKDNRIPPQGFDIANAAARIADPVWHGVSDPNYFTAAEYAGGYDDVNLTVPGGAAAVTVELYYQTTSREYIEFLRDETNGAGNTLPPEAYVIQTDPFFANLRAWGDTIWQLWTNNMNVPGAAPVLMTATSVGDIGACTAPTPTLIDAVPAHSQVTLSWSDEHSADPDVTGYNVYYDQNGKAQLVAGVGLTTGYLDSGLTNGQQYCYKVTSVTAGCESAFSNILCATPTNQGQATQAGVSAVETGFYQGRGGNATFVLSSSFNAGDEVVIRGYVIDNATGAPVANATVEFTLSGPSSAVLTSGPTGANGMAEVKWKTEAPKGNKPGTPAGAYTVATTNVSFADTYVWDGIMRSATFNLQ